MRCADLVIIGAGPAAMGAAAGAYENGIRDIVLLERDTKMGGILGQCIHNGFGLHYFNEELTGPEYANRFIQIINEYKIPVMLDTMVIDITPDKIVTAVNKKDGLVKIKAKAVILAMGCRERTRANINICGSRPSGVITAGLAQRLVNLEGYMPGREIVILGSGDVGLIMARRLTLEGVSVKAVLEIMPKSSGLTRNIAQCLDDFGIPLMLNTTVTEIHGKLRVEGITYARVDKNLKPIRETCAYLKCDTLLLSVGLIPENELSLKCGAVLDYTTAGPVVSENMQTSVQGIFACGNVVHVHDLVDNVTYESLKAGKSAAEYIKEAW